MKTLALPLFAAAVLVGFTSIAGAGLAALAGAPGFVSQQHDHHEQVVPAPAPVKHEQAPLLSDAPKCDHAKPSDASVPCEA